MNKKGIILVEVIIVITLLAIIVAGATVYIAETLRFDISTIEQDKALYAAQAGVMRTIVDYQDGGTWDSAQDVNLMDEFYYQLGEDANFLLVNASNVQLSGGDEHLRRIPIQNINATSSITITNMTVTWTFGGDIDKVKLGGSTVWDDSASSPADIDITDFAIASGVSHTGNNDQKWEFEDDITGDIEVTFIFSDGSSYKALLLDDDNSVDNEFSIKATGEVRNAAVVKARRTLVATYDVGEDEITSWEESAGHIIP